MVFCLLFTLIILPAQYEDPINMIMSYPPGIRKRVEELPQYKGTIKQREKAHFGKKIFGLLFFVVNIYDMIVLDWGIFCHSKKLRIPGTEDMDKEYKDYMFHAKGTCVGIVLGLMVALLSGGIIHIFAAA